MFQAVGYKYLDPNFKPVKEDQNNKKDEGKIVLDNKDFKKEEKQKKKSFC